MGDFNLMRYPTLVHQERLRQRMWGFMSGWTGSCVLAWVALQCLSMNTDALRHDLHHLQQQAVERQQQTQAAQGLAVQRQSQARQHAFLAQVQAQQQASLRLHTALQDEATRSGLSLQRLQIESDRLEVQAQAPHAQAVTGAGQRLSERLGQPLTLASLSEAPQDAGASAGRLQAVAFSWQGAWPRLADAAPKGRQP
jgi:hypothetical protein